MKNSYDIIFCFVVPVINELPISIPYCVFLPSPSIVAPEYVLI